MKEENYITVNKQSWNDRVSSHFESDFYDVERFTQGKSSLNSIELELLGDLKGKKILHLQCHFGQDSLSLAREGAIVTGIDFSEEAIDTARQLAKTCGLDVNFVCSDVYKVPEVLQEKFDIVYTSYGVIGWLPDMDKWADVIRTFLKPNGKLVLVEFHPVVWMFDDDCRQIVYSYFNKGPLEFEEEGTYAAKEANIKLKTISWNHDLAEVFQALLKNNIAIKSFTEYDYSPYNCFNNTIEIAKDKFQLIGLEGKIPMVYAIVGQYFNE